jgi:hypothetical protein
MIAGKKRINEEPAFATRFPTMKFRNRILLASLTSGMNVKESIETTWRILAEVETSHGRMLIQIGSFHPNVRKLLVACNKQFEDSRKRNGMADAPGR